VIFVVGAVFLVIAIMYFLRASSVSDLFAAALIALLGVGLIIMDVSGELKNTL
jgi:hypothetical protein